MGGIKSEELARSGFELDREVVAGLPMTVWVLDLEVERQREVSAAELAVLNLIERCGAGGAREDMARHLGLGSDTRLVERVLVKALGAGAVEVFDGGFRVTEVGRRWIVDGTARLWEHVTFELQHDPLRDSLEWWVKESSVGDKEVWTLDLPRVGDERLTEHLSELGRLVRDEGLPDEEERGKGNPRPKVELRHAAIVARRLHWREVRVAFWQRALSAEVRLVGSIGGAEHPPLTALLAGLVVDSRGRRLKQAA